MPQVASRISCEPSPHRAYGDFQSWFDTFWLYSYLLHYDPTQAVRNKYERKILRELSEIHIKDDFDVLQAVTCWLEVPSINLLRYPLLSLPVHQ